MESFVNDLSRSLSQDLKRVDMSSNHSNFGESFSVHIDGSGKNYKSPSRRQDQLKVTPSRRKLTTSRDCNRLSNTTTPAKGSRPSKSPSRDISDRFIPARSQENFNAAYHKIFSKESDNSESSSYERSIKEACEVDESGPIFKYKVQPKSVQTNLNPTGVAYKQASTWSTNKSKRHIPTTAENILDAPELIDDYYLNLLDWSLDNKLAIALRNYVFLWNADNGNIEQLLSLDESANEYVSSLKWANTGDIIAIGTSSGKVQLWNAKECRLLRTMAGHSTRVGCLAWRDHILASGSRSGHLNYHDVSQQNHLIKSVAAHTQEICGMQYGSRYLATGGNDNLLKIWPFDMSTSDPVFTLSDHQAAVKGVAWCPWQSNILASGGGTTDRCIKLWNVNSGTCIKDVDAKSQVSGILWCENYKELISGHGFSDNQLSIWKYPSMNKVCDLLGHGQRVLSLAMSPDTTMVASAGADETLRLWKCFAIDAKQKKKAPAFIQKTRLSVTGSIR